MRFFAVIVFLCNVIVAFGQDSIECRSAIRKAFKVLQNAENLMKTGVFIDYTSEMCLAPEFGSKCGKDSAQLIMKDKKSALLSNGKRIYRDDSIQVVIMDDRKQIFINAMRVIDKDKLPNLNFAGIQDSLLYTSGYTDCKLEMDGRDSCYAATLNISEKIQKQTGVRKAHYIVNKTKGLMKKIALDYVEGKQFKTAVFVIKTANFNYGVEPFIGSALLNIFDLQGKLLKAYEAYQITDLRNTGVTKP